VVASSTDVVVGCFADSAACVLVTPCLRYVSTRQHATSRNDKHSGDTAAMEHFEGAAWQYSPGVPYSVPALDPIMQYVYAVLSGITRSCDHGAGACSIKLRCAPVPVWNWEHSL
jgi:hypothetical protein